MGRSNNRDGSVFTTGQIARLLKVSPRTVNSWCDHGMLKHWRVPSATARAGDRRVIRKNLLAFMAEHGLPGLDEMNGQITEGERLRAILEDATRELKSLSFAHPSLAQLDLIQRIDEELAKSLGIS